jgi:hypothetical protein
MPKKTSTQQGYQQSQNSETDKTLRCNCNGKDQMPAAVPYRRINCLQSGGPALHVASVAQCIYCGRVFGEPKITATGHTLGIMQMGLSMCIRGNRNISDFYINELQSGKLDFIPVSAAVLNEIQNRKMAGAL